jgi:plastocyanin
LEEIHEIASFLFYDYFGVSSCIDYGEWANCLFIISRIPNCRQTLLPITTASPTPATTPNSVNIQGFAFSPQTLTVAKGTTVTWTNKDSTTHTVTSDDGVWDSGNFANGKTFSYTFNQTGTFPYHCSIHPSMTAKVVVQ